MITTLEALKVRVKDRYRLRSCKLLQRVLECTLRTGSVLLVHFKPLEGELIEVTNYQWIKPE
jgi:hypothetical protein